MSVGTPRFFRKFLGEKDWFLGPRMDDLGCGNGKARLLKFVEKWGLKGELFKRGSLLV